MPQATDVVACIVSQSSVGQQSAATYRSTDQVMPQSASTRDYRSTSGAYDGETKGASSATVVAGMVYRRC